MKIILGWKLDKSPRKQAKTHNGRKKQGNMGTHWCPSSPAGQMHRDRSVGPDCPGFQATTGEQEWLWSTEAGVQ